MSDIPELPEGAFSKPDQDSDARFYAAPRFVAHIDARAVAAVTDLYRRVLPQGGSVLDLMSSWISHLPEEVPFGAVVGVGMNAEELAANPRLTEWAVHDLNHDPVVPSAAERFDAAVICVSVQYLQRPVAVLRSVASTLKPGAPLVVTFSDRCFPTKAVAIWTALEDDDRARLVSLYLQRAGFVSVAATQLLERDHVGDPLWSVVGTRG